MKRERERDRECLGGECSSAQLRRTETCTEEHHADTMLSPGWFILVDGRGSNDPCMPQVRVVRRPSWVSDLRHHEPRCAGGVPPGSSSTRFSPKKKSERERERERKTQS